MIEPEMKNIFINGEPDAIDDFALGGSANIGIKGKAGADYFYFKVMTPRRILVMLEDKKIINGRGVFIVNEDSMELNVKLIESEINKILVACIRPTWNEVANALNKYLKWEYDEIQHETLEQMRVRISSNK